MILDDWDSVDKDSILRLDVPTRSRRVVMAQYWFDRINCVRDSYLRKKEAEDNINNKKNKNKGKKKP